MNSRPSELHMQPAVGAISTGYGTATVPTIRRAASVPATISALHPGAFLVVVASYLALLGIAWIGFVGDIDSGVAMVVNTTYFAMYFGVPVVLARVGGFKLGGPGLSRFLKGKHDTFTGAISGWGALTQMAVVPISLAFGLAAMGVIMRLMA